MAEIDRAVAQSIVDKRLALEESHFSQRMQRQQQLLEISEARVRELDAENKLLKERLETSESGRASQRGSQLSMRMDDSADRKFYNDLHATLMASLVHTTTRPEVDQLGNHPDAIDPQKLISKALSMLQARIASSTGPDAVSHAQADGAGTGSSSSSRVLSPPRGPNMHLQTRFTGAPASPSFVASRQSLQTPSSVISSQVKSTKHNSGFV